eukprot:TRINITY_DN37883_c0_g1_i1.p1 TRINITY_DN37883_c0_g1~~TRINITY_DN37883_c0_g1_i1.p1  ORF type:complete len:240 (+),score=37.29 TRINITY_DN37883_c0_g1_i1:123-842(+)
MQKGLSRGFAGSYGKSLRDVATEVETRLSQMDLREDESGISGHRPHQGSCGRMSSLQLPGRGGEELPPTTGFSPRTNAHNWPSSQVECPLSARDGYDGRPTTRDGGRPGTQDGGRMRIGSFNGARPVTRDGPPAEHMRQTLDGVRPNTRDGARLQQMIDGNRRGGGVAGDAGARPTTRDSLRPPRTGRKKRHSSQTPPEVQSLDSAPSSPSPEPRPPCNEWAPECLSPCMDGDESELLE